MLVAVALKLQSSSVRYFAVVSVKTETMSAKLAVKMQFLNEILAAETGMVAVVAVSKVNVGRREPMPNPTIATPATLAASAVALEIVSACPGLTKMISPRLATQRLMA